MIDKTTYTIEVNPEQAKVIMHSLDIFERIHMRQLTEVAEVLRFSKGIDTKDIATLRNILDFVARPLVIPDGSHGHYGITSREISNDARVAWDIHQWLRYKMAWTENPKGGDGVSFYSPMKTSDQPPPQVSVKQTKVAANIGGEEMKK